MDQSEIQKEDNNQIKGDPSKKNVQEKKPKKVEAKDKNVKPDEKSNKTIPTQSLNTIDTNDLWKIWENREISIPETSYSLKGFSVAALRTNFYIKELAIMLDAGMSSPNYCIDYIFVTHCHSDHTANVAFHIYSARENSNKMQIYSPKEAVKRINSYIISAYRMSCDLDDSIKDEDLYVNRYYNINPVVPEDRIELTIKNRKYSVEVIKCYHSVPCVGYGFIEKRTKLKEEYLKLSGKEIGELRKKGVEINYEKEHYILCFLGDTSKEIFVEEKIKKYRSVMIECTFLYEDDVEQADKTCHMHWKYLEDYIKVNTQQTFILYHFSQRYKKNEIADFFKKVNLPNIIPWID